MTSNLQPLDCPFCGGEVRDHPHPAWKDQYYAAYHLKECWLCDGDDPYDFTLIPKNDIEHWNFRHK